MSVTYKDIEELRCHIYKTTKENAIKIFYNDYIERIYNFSRAGMGKRGL